MVTQVDVISTPPTPADPPAVFEERAAQVWSDLARAVPQMNQQALDIEQIGDDADAAKARAIAEADLAMGYRNAAQAAALQSGGFAADANAAKQAAELAQEAAEEAKGDAEGFAQAAAQAAADAENRVQMTSDTGAMLVPGGSESDRPDPTLYSGKFLLRGRAEDGSLEWYDREAEDWRKIGAADDLAVANAKIAELEAEGKRVTSGSVVMTAIDNKIVMTGIVGALGLEKGDVVEIDAPAISYKKLHTVESILNANEIVVNYEHCGGRGNGSLKLEDFTGPVTIKRIAKWYNASPGMGQDWVNVTSLRTINVDSINTSGRTIAVSAVVVDSGNGYASLIIGGIIVGRVSSPSLSDATAFQLYADVKSEKPYRISRDNSSQSLQSIHEMR